MAATITDYANNVDTGGASFIATSPNGSVVTGEWFVSVLAASNDGSAGASCFSAYASKTYLTQSVEAHINFDPGAAGAGATLVLATHEVTTNEATPNVQANFSPNFSQASIQLYKVTPGASETISFIAADTTGSTGNDTTHAAPTAPSVASGDIIFGGGALETDDAISGDADTTNGSWSSILTRLADGGADANCMSSSSQHKTTTGAGDQDWACTTSSGRDSARSYLVLRSATSGTTFNQDVLTTSSPVGALVRQTGKPLATSSALPTSLSRQSGKLVLAANSPAAAIVRAISKALATQSAPPATMTKQTAKSLATETAPTATLIVSRVFLKLLEAVTSPIASLSRQTGKIVGATAGGTVAAITRLTGKIVQAIDSPEASLKRDTAKSLLTSSAPIAALSALRVVLLTLQAACSPVAALIRQTGKPVATSSSLESALARQTTKTATTQTAPVGTATKQTAKPLSTLTSPVATLSAIRVFLKFLQAITDPVASLTRQTAKSLASNTSPPASLIRLISKALSTTTSPVASLIASRQFMKALQATADAAVTLARSTGKIVATTTNPVASIVRQIGKAVLTNAVIAATLEKIPTLLSGPLPVPGPIGPGSRFARARAALGFARVRTSNGAANPRGTPGSSEPRE